MILGPFLQHVFRYMKYLRGKNIKFETNRVKTVDSRFIQKYLALVKR